MFFRRNKQHICVSKKMKFAAAHRLLHHPGKCKNLHGHEWYVIVHLTVPEKVRKSNPHKISVDFNNFSIFKDWIDSNLDHALLVASFDKELYEVATKLKTKFFVLPDTSAEEISVFLAKTFSFLLREKKINATVEKIEVFESVNNLCTLSLNPEI